MADIRKYDFGERKAAKSMKGTKHVRGAAQTNGKLRQKLTITLSRQGVKKDEWLGRGGVGGGVMSGAYMKNDTLCLVTRVSNQHANQQEHTLLLPAIHTWKLLFPKIRYWRERGGYFPNKGTRLKQEYSITKLSWIKLNWIFSSSPHWSLLYKRCKLSPFEEARVAFWVFYKGDTTHQTYLIWRVRHLVAGGKISLLRSCVSVIWATDKTSDTSDCRRTMAHASSPQYPARSSRIMKGRKRVGLRKLCSHAHICVQRRIIRQTHSNNFSFFFFRPRFIG